MENETDFATINKEIITLLIQLYLQQKYLLILS